MRLTILGSGTMMPTPERYPAAYLVEQGDTNILLDCGHLAIARLVEHGVNLHDIDAVAITHFHTDHFSNLLPLVHARWVDDVTKKHSHQPLTVLGPPTLTERWQKLREVFWPEPTESYPLAMQEGTTAQEIGNITIQSFPVRHVPWFPSVGYRLTAENRSLAYTGDLSSEQDESFFDTLRDADLLLIEAGTETPSPTHLTAKQAAELARQCGIRRVVLTHLRDHTLAAARQAIAQYPNLLSLASDGMALEI